MSSQSCHCRLGSGLTSCHFSGPSKMMYWGSPFSWISRLDQRFWGVPAPTFNWGHITGFLHPASHLFVFPLTLPLSHGDRKTMVRSFSWLHLLPNNFFMYVNLVFFPPIFYYEIFNMKKSWKNITSIYLTPRFNLCLRFCCLIMSCSYHVTSCQQML